ncbi:hypothetical protein EOA33_24080 [Mesorhizobium sp. M4A.F.Ca.ET.050.02.1.1]|uniref:hypothetical protein n=1 Tax=Mesorhizobium sp. M4A.F.Ca.ET.050.02.1.1 TaxID=2496754 RepID=UPI000FCB3578|nr:hypothetical protein [Mesorhizobium sp. M4A.F.Ca.ET.050.02.1.1]RUX45424.1 hypothetical protein EOA33_24080 [Mesorhizobium sp. M4A.F.Ca.ET.050.02.1.1]
MARGRGRPPKFDVESAFAAAEAGGGVFAIADRLGVDRRTLVKWQNRHPGFREAIERGRATDAEKPTYEEYVEALDLHQRATALKDALAGLLPAAPAEPDPRDAERAEELQRAVEKIAPRPLSPVSPDRLNAALMIAAAARPSIARSRRGPAPEARPEPTPERRPRPATANPATDDDTPELPSPDDAWRRRFGNGMELHDPRTGW